MAAETKLIPVQIARPAPEALAERAAEAAPRAAQEAAIAVKDLKAYYGTKLAVTNVTFDAAPRAVTAWSRASARPMSWSSAACDARHCGTRSRMRSPSRAHHSQAASSSGSASLAHWP